MSEVRFRKISIDIRIKTLKFLKALPHSLVNIQSFNKHIHQCLIGNVVIIFFFTRLTDTKTHFCFGFPNSQYHFS